MGAKLKLFCLMQKNISTKETLNQSQMLKVKGGNVVEESNVVKTAAKGTPVSTTGSIAKPTSV
jgi:hypothetical protein